MEFTVHPFKPYIPRNATKLFLGSFPPPKAPWYYSSPVNQFWKILSVIYDVELTTIETKKEFLRKNNFAMMDIIYKCRRKNASDKDLDIIELFDMNKYLEGIETIYFTSRFVERLFNKNFKVNIRTITLPSPSPRYARISFKEKCRLFSKIFLSQK